MIRQWDTSGEARRQGQQFTGQRSNPTAVTTHMADHGVAHLVTTIAGYLNRHDTSTQTDHESEATALNLVQAATSQRRNTTRPSAPATTIPESSS